MQYFEALYRLVDPQGTGEVGAARVVEFLTSSGACVCFVCVCAVLCCAVLCVCVPCPPYVARSRMFNQFVLESCGVIWLGAVDSKALTISLGE